MGLIYIYFKIAKKLTQIYYKINKKKKTIHFMNFACLSSNKTAKNP